MKTQKFKFLLILLLISGMAGFSHAAEISKSLHKEFKVSGNSVFTLQNKYGKVDIQNWEKNELVIDVKIIIEHPSKEKAEKLLDYLNVEFSSSGNEIKAITRIDDHVSQIRGSDLGDEKKFSINYTVKMPKSLDLNL